MAKLLILSTVSYNSQLSVSVFKSGVEGICIYLVQVSFFFYRIIYLVK